jgi:hypothetical protein
MVSRHEFAAALQAAKIPLLSLMQQAPASFRPNVEVTRTPGDDRSLFELWKGRIFGFPDFASHSAGAKAAVVAARESMERRLARALQSARVLEGDSLDLCIAGMHTILHARAYPIHDRFGVMPAGAWDKLARSNPDFGAAMDVWPSAKLWKDMIWVRSRHLEEVQAVMFHKSAFEGRIEPLDPSPGQAASAEVTVRVVDPEGVRVLRWPSGPVG